ncbi:hypothetical protein HDU67_001441 [Dinochytrium kinnereticum]|nr:hypothetical protein HDU67_001441 [Dinochytrium kinnereticum]
MVKQLDELAVEVNETWSRKLKVVEDRVQQDENSRLIATGMGKELWYQVLAYLLTALAFLIWLAYQGMKVGKFASNFARMKLKALKERRAIPTNPSDSSAVDPPKQIDGKASETDAPSDNFTSNTSPTNKPATTPNQ